MMKPYHLKFFVVVMAAAALGASPFFLGHADARRGGGGLGRGGGGAARGYGAGGFSGGSFRSGGGYARGPRGGGVARGPRGGTAAVGPRGGAAVRGPGGYGAARGPRGGTAARGPGGTYVKGRPAQLPAGGSYRGNVNINRNVTVNQGWGAWGGYYRPGAVAAGVAIGAAVAALPYGYQTQVVNNQTYYVSNGTYYQQCYQGADVSYCAVPSPNP